MNYLRLASYEAIGKYKSIRRAIRRGHISPMGVIYPNRPFGNTNTKMNRIRRKIYGNLKNLEKPS